MKRIGGPNDLGRPHDLARQILQGNGTSLIVVQVEEIEWVKHGDGSASIGGSPITTSEVAHRRNFSWNPHERRLAVWLGVPWWAWIFVIPELVIVVVAIVVAAVDGIVGRGR